MVGERVRGIQVIPFIFLYTKSYTRKRRRPGNNTFQFANLVIVGAEWLPWHSLPNKIPPYQVNLNFYEESIEKFRGLCCLPAVARARLSAILTRETGSLSLLICYEGLSPQPRPLCVVGRLGRGKKEIARGTMGRGKRPAAAHLRFSTFAAFIVIPSISFCAKAMQPARMLKRTKEQPLVFLFNTMRYLSNLYQERIEITQFERRSSSFI